MHLCVEPPPIYFMHVPKTGGVALGQWLRSGYGRGYFDLDLPQITKLTGHDIRGFRCYHAWHHGRSLLEWLRRPDLAVITMLRDPIERLVSEFDHYQRAYAAYPDQFKAEFLATVRRLAYGELQDHLEDPFVTQRLSNGQSRLLGIRREYPTFLARIVQAAPDEQATALRRPYAVRPLIKPDAMPLLTANAHAWLDEMVVVGLTERYAESMLLIADLLGIPAPAEPPRANVNPQRTSPNMRYREQLARDVVARLEELNRYDLELYAHATQLFEQQWAHYRARPRRTYSIAPRLRIPVRRAESRLKGWLRRTWPGLAATVRQARILM